ncbi:sensor domain-containing diguanylate cyclase [Lysobacter sp. CA199]|uniref:sensor domain-containing diguanylate cyclase n=1 Tax=Lysobacter sp. CA199 TaxID=3455608 RepID=UPI003F8D5A54
MDRYLRRAMQIVCLLLVTLTTVGAAPMPALEVSFLAPATGFTAERILAGEAAEHFEPASSGEVVIMGKEPQWLRVVAHRDYPQQFAPNLVMTQPYRKTIEVWRPGDHAPLRRATYGADADLNHSTLFHVIPLPNGLRRGDVIYLRAKAVDVRPSRFTIESAAYVHRMDMTFGRARTFVLTSLSIVAVLALGFGVSLRQRGYAYLALTLAAQAVTLAIEGGEVREFAWLVSVAQDHRTNILLNTTATLASVRFLMFFLSIPPLQPRIAKVLNACSVVFLALIAVSTVHVWYASAMIGNVTLLVAIVSVFKAILHALHMRQREAFFLLLAWTPLMVVAVIRVGGLQGWLPIFDWVEFALPFTMTVGGLGLLFGMTDKLRQLRRENETARHRATHDGLTGVLTRSALDDAMHAATEAAHTTGRPLSVVFFDIDHFKRVNDDNGHATGDEVLRIVALRTLNRLRPFDVFGRYGGDEMLVGLPGATLDEAVLIAEHVRGAVSGSPISIDGRRLEVGISMGVAQLREGETLGALLRRADIALYQSKAQGRGRVTGSDLQTPTQPFTA